METICTTDKHHPGHTAGTVHVHHTCNMHMYNIMLLVPMVTTVISRLNEAF